MSVPPFPQLLLPLLEAVADGVPHRERDLAPQLADRLGLTEADLREILPKRGQPRFENRLYWARLFLKQAGLVELAGGGLFQITEQGRQVLGERPRAIDVPYLEQFPAFREFQERAQHGKESTAPAPDSDDTPALSPDEMLATAWQSLRFQLAQELLDRIHAAAPSFFEKLVLDVLVAMGYGGSRQDAALAVGGVRDGGIDGLIKEDRLGLDTIYVQAKRWNGVVGRPLVQAFAGSLDAHHAHKGVFITTSAFTEDARQFAGSIEKRIALIDGLTLANLMIDNGVGVTTQETYEVRKVDLDYFEEQ
ncbi:MAG: restriction endonuclease [Candidatus Dormibacteria bacterium]